MKGNWSTAFLVLILLLGLGILLYPSVSDYYNSFHQSRAIASYIEQVDQTDPQDYAEDWERARAYNASLAEKADRFTLSEEDYREYEANLNPTGTGIIGYIEIPRIGCSLPIYHGTDDAVLQIAVGHVEGSSLPTGEMGTHAVLSGHRGLPSAKLLSDLDKLEVGDLFVIRVLDRIMTYEVDQILIVLPYELSGLEIDPEMDLCTLVTCTPYGINTHRLLVRGHRTENQEMERIVKVSADAKQIEPVLVAPVLAVPALALLLVWMLIATRRRRPRRNRR